MKCQEIEIALYDKSAILLRDMLFRHMEAIKNFALMVDDGFRRVDVLGLSLLQDPSSKPHGPMMEVKDGEHDPSPEDVVPPLSFSGKDEPQFPSHLEVHLLVAKMLDQPIPAFWSIAKLVFLQKPLAHAPLRQVSPRGLPLFSSHEESVKIFQGDLVDA
jgi:hypothetical protein